MGGDELAASSCGERHCVGAALLRAASAVGADGAVVPVRGRGCVRAARACGGVETREFGTGLWESTRRLDWIAAAGAGSAAAATLPSPY